MQAASENLLQKVRAAAAELCQTWPAQSPAFAVRTGWTNSYDNLLSGEFEAIYEEGEILGPSLVKGRAMLAGRGGDGKTWLLRRLHQRTLASAAVPIFIDLKQWSGADYDAWADWTSDDIGNGADFIVRRFAGLEIGAIDLDRLPPEVEKVIFVDGLNEITSKVGGEILIVLDGIVSNQINVSVIVADRLIRRDLPNSKRWRIGTPLPLSEAEVRKHLGGEVQLKVGDARTSPFFLDAELKFGVGGGRRTATLDRLLRTHSDLEEADLGAVAVAAFDAYRRSRSRTFDRDSFEEIAGSALLESLEQSGTIASHGGKSYFVHQILHDYLAASHVAHLSDDLWIPELFRVLSFDASSFDAVELAFEQLNQNHADVFLRKLYDWNLYAAGYALAQAREADETVGREMRTVIFAMLADKAFDAVLATRQRAKDALRLMQLADAGPFRTASSLSEICAALDAVESDAIWFNEWKSLFQQVEKTEVFGNLLAEIRSEDSIVGWTVANVARRVDGDEQITETLTEWLRDEQNPTVRWRIAHVLGALPTDSSLSALLELLDRDPDQDVRYGAIRSLVELSAAADQSLRERAGAALAARAPAISGQEKIARELRSCLLLDPSSAPVEWLDFVRTCVRSQFLESEKVSDRDLWRGCLNAAEDLYSAQMPSSGD